MESRLFPGWVRKEQEGGGSQPTVQLAWAEQSSVSSWYSAAQTGGSEGLCMALLS